MSKGQLLHNVASLKSLKEAFVSDHTGTDHLDVLQLVLLVPCLSFVLQCTYGTARDRHGARCRICAECLLIAVPATLSVMTYSISWISATLAVAMCALACHQWQTSNDRCSSSLQQLAEQPRKRSVEVGSSFCTAYACALHNHSVCCAQLHHLD